MSRNSELLKTLKVGVLAGERDCKGRFHGFGQYETEEQIPQFINDLENAKIFGKINYLDSMKRPDLVMILTTCRANKFCGTPAVPGMLTLGLIPLPIPDGDYSYRFSIYSPLDTLDRLKFSSSHHYPKMLWWFSPFLNISSKWSFIFNNKKYAKRLGYEVSLKAQEIIRLISENQKIK